MRPLRILVGADVPPDPNSGAAGTVWHTNEALRELGHEVDAFWSDSLPHHIQHGNLHYWLELPKGYRDVVRRKCAEKDYDVIQLSQPHAWLAARDHRISGRPGVFVNRSHGWELLADAALDTWHKRLNVPQNRFPRSAMTAFLRSRLHRNCRRAVRYSDGMLVPAEDIREHMVNDLGAPPEKIACVPHGVQDVFAARPAAAMDEARLRRVLYVGQFAFIKGPCILSEAFSTLAATHPDLEFTWVCDEAHHDQARAMLSRDARSRVQLTHWRPQEELLQLYDSHGIFLFPSFYEGAAKACLEAMCRGMCVAATDVGAMRDYIRDGENGFLIPAGDAPGLVRAAERVLADARLAADMGARARDAVSALTWRRCAEGATAFYHELLAGRGADRNERKSYA